MRRLQRFALVCLGLLPNAAGAQPAPDAVKHDLNANVVFGMYSGLALLMDVYTPAPANGYGVLFVQGSGFYSPLGYDAPSLKNSPAVGPMIAPLLDAGYTVFVVNHRASPRFQHPAALEDVQRAVRFVRSNADKYAINPDRIGAAGTSSGGTLVCLAALAPSEDDPSSNDPVSRASASLQAVVALAVPVDLSSLLGPAAASLVTSYIGAPVFPGSLAEPQTGKRLKDASPLYQVHSGAPPTLLVHGEADDLVPITQVEAMDRALGTVGAPHKLIRIPNGTHDELDVSGGPDYRAEMKTWFDEWLRRR